MKGELIRLRTADGINLEGIITNGRKNNIVIHLHGLEDNFHERPFLNVMAEKYHKAGFDFLSFDNRGHDFYSQTEKFIDCVLDIDAAIKFTKSRGYKNIVLQGHSTGCQKIIYYTQQKNTKLKGIILLCPVSDCEYMEYENKQGYIKNMQRARELVKKGKGNSYILLKGEKWPITAQRYLSLGEFGGAEDMFSLNLSKKVKKKFQGVTFSTLLIYAGRDKYVIHPIREMGDFLAKAISSSVTQKYISYANHNFKGKEKELVKAVTDWLKLIK